MPWCMNLTVRTLPMSGYYDRDKMNRTGLGHAFPRSRCGFRLAQRMGLRIGKSCRLRAQRWASVL